MAELRGFCSLQRSGRTGEAERTSLPPLLRSFGGGQQPLYPFLFWGQKSEHSREDHPRCWDHSASHCPRPRVGSTRKPRVKCKGSAALRVGTDHHQPRSLRESHSPLSLRSRCPSLNIRVSTLASLG